MVQIVSRVRILAECSDCLEDDPRLGNYWGCLRLVEFLFPLNLAVSETERTKNGRLIRRIADTEHLLSTTAGGTVLEDTRSGAVHEPTADAQSEFKYMRSSMYVHWEWLASIKCVVTQR